MPLRSELMLLPINSIFPTTSTPNIRRIYQMFMAFFLSVLLLWSQMVSAGSCLTCFLHMDETRSFWRQYICQLQIFWWLHYRQIKFSQCSHILHVAHLTKESSFQIKAKEYSQFFFCFLHSFSNFYSCCLWIINSTKLWQSKPNFAFQFS